MDGRHRGRPRRESRGARVPPPVFPRFEWELCEATGTGCCDFASTLMIWCIAGVSRPDAEAGQHSTRRLPPCLPAAAAASAAAAARRAATAAAGTGARRRGGRCGGARHRGPQGRRKARRAEATERTPRIPAWAVAGLLRRHAGCCGFLLELLAPRVLAIQ